MGKCVPVLLDSKGGMTLLLISQSFNWPAMNWPSTSTPATQYTVLQLYPLPQGQTTPTVIATVTGVTTFSLAFDDSKSSVYQVRPSSGDGVLTPLTYGPETGVFVNGYVPCQAWLRQKVRYALSDRTDGTSTTKLKWPDDELDAYIEEAFAEFNVLFPYENDATITLLPPTVVNSMTVGVRDYAMPADFYQARSVEYITQDGRLHLFLKEKSFIGGESTASSYLGYPKLGILLSPVAGRYYPGHYDIYENALHLDWDPAGNGDTLHIRYSARRPAPTSDGDLINMTQEDFNILNMRVQMSCWLRIENNDVSLSRFIDNKKRDDLPTAKMSDTLKKIYDQLVEARKDLRPKATKRLVRR